MSDTQEWASTVTWKKKVAPQRKTQLEHQECNMQNGKVHCTATINAKNASLHNKNVYSAKNASATFKSKLITIINK
jgi:hypothetical protein